MFVQFAHAEDGSFLKTFFEKSGQVVFYIGSGEHAFHGYFRCFVQGFLQGCYTTFHQQFVGILAAGTIAHDTTAFFAQPTDEFGAEFQSFGIGIGGDVHGPLIFEMRFHEIVEEGQVGLGTVGYADYIVPSCHEEGQGIHFAFGDDTFRGVADVVDAPRHESGTAFEHEVFCSVAVLAVDEFAVDRIGKDDAALHVACLWEGTAYLGDVFFGQHFGGYASGRKPGLHVFVQRLFVGEWTGLSVAFGGWWLERCRCRCVV